MDNEREQGAGESGSLAEWLRERMAQRGLGQRQLAKFSQVSVGTISAILHGRVTPRADVVSALATYFGEDPSAVLAQTGSSALEAAPPEARAEAAALLRRLYALSPADRSRILRQISEILDFLERAPSDPSAPPGHRVP
jgi:transcriptional regulator with XRE-family HTH domain